MGYFSNGTDGEMYEAGLCVHCVHYSDEEHPCAVLQLHMLRNYEDCNKPDSPLHVLIPRDDEGDNQECRMFWPRRGSGSHEQWLAKEGLLDGVELTVVKHGNHGVEIVG